jgi:hypothetical protein
VGPGSTGSRTHFNKKAKQNFENRMGHRAGVPLREDDASKGCLATGLLELLRDSAMPRVECEADNAELLMTVLSWSLIDSGTSSFCTLYCSWY